jgi:PAS domain S-box-containing protein
MDMKALDVLKSVKLLYVEDDKETREELTMILEPWVGELHVAADGEEGLKLFRETNPDIVVTDIQMPRVSGLAMSSEIRRLVPDQPIIVVSAYNDVEYLFRAIELGIDHYITKPLNVDRLLDKLINITTANLAIKERRLNHVLLEQYKHLVDESAIVCKLDLTGKITYVNAKMCEISGFAEDELIGREMSELQHDSELPQRAQITFTDARSGRKWAGIVKNRRNNGEMYVVERSLVPIVNDHGAVAEIVVLDVDVTPFYENYKNLVEVLSRTHLTLEEQRHFVGEYKRALELGTCVCVTDQAHHIVSINRQFETLLGLRSADLEGEPVSRIMPDLRDQHCLDEVQQANQEHFTSRVVTIVGREGKEMQFSVGFVGVHDLSGAVRSIIMICQDITESMRLSRDIVNTQRELLYMLGEVVESRSQETGEHIRRVAQVSKFLALKAGLDPDTAEMIETTAPMHDVGKVGIRDAILQKPGKLTADEYEEMKAHASIGFSILGKVDRPLIGVAANIAYQHHERHDGKGYPRGLKGDEISIEARIVGIADVLDALLSSRIYKPAWDEQRAYDYFHEQRGKQFSPELTDLLLTHWDAVMDLRNGNN